MPSDLAPDSIRSATFRTAFRGHDPKEVASLLDAVAHRMEELDAELAKLKTQIGDPGRVDLEHEFETVGREVSAILQTARAAAEAMRERADQEAERWRTEARDEAAAVRSEAHADSEALRRDAWVVGTELLDQAQSTAENMRAAAERDVLTVMGEAEREAHRLTSGARREAEDVVRGANVEAEGIITEAMSRREEIIDGANRQAATAQERTRALETRREELLAELENLRSTLTRVEGSLEERREALEKVAQEPASVRVVHPPPETKEEWELGETVRVIKPEGEDEPAPPTAEEMSEEVARIQGREPSSNLSDPIREPSQPETESESQLEPAPPRAPVDSPTQPAGVAPQPGPASDPESGTQPGSDPGPSAPQRSDLDIFEAEPVVTVSEPEPDQESGQAPDTDELDALFASLRSPPESELDPGAEVNEPADDSQPDEETEDPTESGEGIDWIALREASLIPITNRALRGIKKVITEMQNVALASLRTEGEWGLEATEVADALHADLVAVWTESFSAGHAAAEQMAGDRIKRPATPPLTEDRRLSEDLAAAVGRALEVSGEDGSRERQSAVSRVFRVWRTDEAERRLRDLAVAGYETGIEMSRSVPTG